MNKEESSLLTLIVIYLLHKQFPGLAKKAALLGFGIFSFLMIACSSIPAFICFVFIFCAGDAYMTYLRT